MPDQMPDEYYELMWLAHKQRQNPLSHTEMERFKELRERWPEMHGEPPLFG